MKLPPIPENEKERLAALKELNILDTEREQDFDDLVMLASSICQIPMSLVGLIDADRQWYKATHGTGGTEVSRDLSFCSHVILQDELMVIPDALHDARFCDNPFVIDKPNIRFYAGMPLTTRDGYNIGTLCVFDSQPNDLSEQQRFALRTLGRQAMNLIELRHANNTLRELNNLQNKFISIISHDVKNPLHGIRALMEMACEHEISGEEFDQLAKGTIHEVDLTLGLLKDLMQWAQSSREESTNIALVHVYELAEAELGKLKELAATKGIKLENRVMPGLKVYADPNMLSFMLRNFVGNAIKFTRKGKITVVGDSTGNGWYLSVADPGIGMSDEQVKKLFSWQQRYTTLGTDKEKGTGLGLLLCREFAEKLGGRIEVKSKPGEGSTFTIQASNQPGKV